MKFNIRKGRKDEIDVVDQLAYFARETMKRRNNPQWSSGYPERERLEKDLENGDLLVACDETDTPVAMMAVVGGTDPNYSKVNYWNSSSDYIAFHRVSSRRHGGAKALFDYVKTHTDKDIRIDTHPDNLEMQRFITENGFIYTGRHNFGFFPDDREALCYEFIIRK